MLADLFVKNGSILHIVIDEVSWPHYLALDADPVQRKHERVELLDRERQPETISHYYLSFVINSNNCVYYLAEVGFGHVVGQESDPVETFLIS